MTTEQIVAFEEECKQYPAQYTPAWFARALESIGGSEMHDLTTAPRALAARKIARIVEAANAPEITLTPSPPPQPIAPRAPSPILPQKLMITSSNVLDDDDDVAPAPIPALAPQPLVATDSNVMDDAASTIPLALIEQAPQIVTGARAKDPVGEFAMGWGTLFEPLLCEFIARTLHVDIRCRSASYFNGVFRYSPDGAFVDSAGNGVLLEMKNPALRIWSGFFDTPQVLADPITLTSNPDAVPQHYLPQLQAGMRLIPFVKYAMYVEAVYRRANYPGGNVSAVGMQKMSGNKRKDGTAPHLREVAHQDAGIIGFYHSSQPLEPLNFGIRSNDAELNRVIAHQRCEDPFIPAYFAANGEPFRARSELPLAHGDLYLFGYMPWNLLGVHGERVDPIPAPITSSLISDAEFVIGAVRECMGAPRERVEATLARVLDAARAARDSAHTIEEIEKRIAECANYYAQKAARVIASTAPAIAPAP